MANEPMEKGDETPNGIYLGERMVDREVPITQEEAIAILGDDAYFTDESGIPQLTNAVTVFQARAVAYVFDSDGTEVEVLVETFTP